MVPFLVIFLDLGTSKKQLSWRKSFLSMLVGACRVCSTKGCHGHLCNGCKMHGPGCCLCGSCAVVRSDSRCFISAQWHQMSCAQGRGTVLSTCTACPARCHGPAPCKLILLTAFLLSKNFLWTFLFKCVCMT